MKLSFWLQNELGPFQTSAFSNGWERNESKTIRPLPQRLSRHSQMLNILFSAVLVFYIPFLPETPLMHLDIVDWAMMMSSLVIKGMALVFVCFLSFPFLTTYTAKTYSSLVFRVLPFVLFLLGFGTLFMVGPV
jgi:hypothetical protein